LLHIEYNVSDLRSLEIFGRFYALTAHIHIDVGHNPLAAQALAKALDEPVVLVYNTLGDKAYEEVLRILRPKVKRVEIIPIDAQRAVAPEALERALQTVGLPYSYFGQQIEEGEHYLVFGSFYVVEAFLKWYQSRTEKSRREDNVPK